ncbi:DNA polymerase Y family protein [Corynebacterium comes]|uniref:DNA polymerase IV n=1 Tax=Corynebacterium comes TaxID=2675218 RepID=A0A6B8VI39_9CORY|nr:DNA polymerase Y family protein [Corynebacterium comes]QGU03833.1 DNA polymerase IV [Corynebacterium comes]
MRVAALWFPDWPVQAARIDDEELPDTLAIAARHRIRVCSQAARRAGVRRDMRVRQAQAVCPGLVVLDEDLDRDGRMFESIAAGLDDVASSVEILRPGLVIVDAGAAGRFHGSEGEAVEMLVDAAARRGVDATVGVADEIATALIAARVGEGRVVPTGGSREFLAAQPVTLLAAETSLHCDAALVVSLRQLGVHTLGDLAVLPATAVSTRFGVAGERCHRIARAAADRRVAPDLPRTDLSVSVTPEDPIDRVDAAAFAARQLAGTLHERLRTAGLSCLRLRVLAELGDGTRLERIWRTREALTEAATADRVRWQLDGWLTSGGAGTIVSLILEPLETAPPDPVASLWHSAGAGDRARARRVVGRVQSTLGTDAVLSPRVVGGRGVAERVDFVPYGEESGVEKRGTWPGRIPGPLPARLGGGPAHPASLVRLVDAAAGDVTVTAEALLSSIPHTLGWGRERYRVAAWAGPWPVDAGWWGSEPQKVARLQVVGQAEDERHPRAWLLLWLGGGVGRWRIEASYF